MRLSRPERRHIKEELGIKNLMQRTLVRKTVSEILSLQDRRGDVCWSCRSIGQKMGIQVPELPWNKRM